jgi:hypothetical protein
MEAFVLSNRIIYSGTYTQKLSDSQGQYEGALV